MLVVQKSIRSEPDTAEPSSEPRSAVGEGIKSWGPMRRKQAKRLSRSMIYPWPRWRVASLEYRTICHFGRKTGEPLEDHPSQLSCWLQLHIFALVLLTRTTNYYAWLLEGAKAPGTESLRLGPSAAQVRLLESVSASVTSPSSISDLLGQYGLLCSSSNSEGRYTNRCSGVRVLISARS